MKRTRMMAIEAITIVRIRGKGQKKITSPSPITANQTIGSVEKKQSIV